MEGLSRMLTQLCSGQQVFLQHSPHLLQAHPRHCLYFRKLHKLSAVTTWPPRGSPHTQPLSGRGTAPPLSRRGNYSSHQAPRHNAHC